MKDNVYCTSSLSSSTLDQGLNEEVDSSVSDGSAGGRVSVRILRFGMNQAAWEGKIRCRKGIKTPTCPHGRSTASRSNATWSKLFNGFGARTPAPAIRAPRPTRLRFRVEKFSGSPDKRSDTKQGFSDTILVCGQKLDSEMSSE